MCPSTRRWSMPGGALKGSHAVVANVAPAAHLAALDAGHTELRDLAGFHVPPPAMPSPPLRHWEPAPRVRLEAADRRVLHAMNPRCSRATACSRWRRSARCSPAERCCSPIPNSMSIGARALRLLRHHRLRRRQGGTGLAGGRRPAPVRLPLFVFQGTRSPALGESQRRSARRSFFAAGSTQN